MHFLFELYYMFLVLIWNSIERLHFPARKVGRDFIFRFHYNIQQTFLQRIDAWNNFRSVVVCVVSATATPRTTRREIVSSYLHILLMCICLCVSEICIYQCSRTLLDNSISHLNELRRCDVGSRTNAKHAHTYTQTYVLYYICWRASRTEAHNFQSIFQVCQSASHTDVLFCMRFKLECIGNFCALKKIRNQIIRPEYD